MNISNIFRARLFKHNMLPEYLRLSFANKLDFSFSIQGEYTPDVVPDQINKVVGISNIFGNHRRSTRIGIRKYYNNNTYSFTNGMYEIFAYRYVKGERVEEKISEYYHGQVVTGSIYRNGDIHIEGEINYAPDGYGVHFLWRLLTPYFGGKLPLTNGIFNIILNFVTN